MVPKIFLMTSAKNPDRNLEFPKSLRKLVDFGITSYDWPKLDKRHFCAYTREQGINGRPKIVRLKNLIHNDKKSILLQTANKVSRT